MFKKFLASLGLGATIKPAPVPPRQPKRSPYEPYGDSGANHIYTLLFCDQPALFKGSPEAAAEGWRATLFASVPDIAALGALATDTTQEHRARYLACARLRELGQPVPKKILFGVIIEVPQPLGLDALAAFDEGCVRYINQSGKMLLINNTAAFNAPVARLFAAAQAVIARTGPTIGTRQPPPRPGNVRMSFLASDGVYVGEGLREEMSANPWAGPVIAAATALLVQAVAAGTDKTTA